MVRPPAAPEAGRGDIIASFEHVRAGSLTQFALERLRAPDQEERALAFEVCGWGTSPGCVEGAIHALLDPSAIVRRAATTALGRLRDPAAAKTLGKALGDSDRSCGVELPGRGRAARRVLAVPRCARPPPTCSRGSVRRPSSC